eukprot:1861607-Pyramimonas_sp.AAC.1
MILARTPGEQVRAACPAEVGAHSKRSKGCGVDVRGPDVDVKGYSVDVRGYGVDVRGPRAFSHINADISRHHIRTHASIPLDVYLPSALGFGILSGTNSQNQVLIR